MSRLEASAKNLTEDPCKCQHAEDTTFRSRALKASSSELCSGKGPESKKGKCA